ncbi:hypothetical protein J422_00671 [Methanocaldococcus villosus KIN24-T80]|uniref:UPF0235 protein J422_00671 n=1 Tax=Methanocaldococcus villosus KIN24-T80 TaxID=1069083 RepID=N6VS53_9EURY|nr:DUF167 family protein [Methanocaldococcus villosus]ENN96710.1 hypothetical protein J422_00671 [Methanocaldococcus villosus KIN24-T80]
MIRECKDGVIVDIEVQPNANKNEIFGINEWRKRVMVKIKAPPVEGKANKEIIKFFRKLFNSDIEILSGTTSSKKSVLIKGVKKEDVERVIKCSYQKK